jgi:hypothetical protein
MQLFKSAEAVSDLDLEDAGYWTIESVSDVLSLIPTEAEADPDPLIALMLKMGAAVTRTDEAAGLPRFAEQADFTDRPVDTLSAYLETVFIVTEEREWLARRAELSTMLDGGTQEEIVKWLVTHRLVFPGFEREVATRIVALNRAHSGGEAAEPTANLRQSVMPTAASLGLGIPQQDLIYEEAHTHQLALF